MQVRPLGDCGFRRPVSIDVEVDTMCGGLESYGCVVEERRKQSDAVEFRLGRAAFLTWLI